MDARTLTLVWLSMVVGGCAISRDGGNGTFGDDVAFLREHTDVVVLSDSGGQGQIAVLPEMQGRVMTSTAAGSDGYSFGWINRELVASGEFIEHINVFGGEDRFWLGPEGGQFSIFFAPGVPFDLDHWYTPAPIDTEPWELTSRTSDSARLRKTMRVKNYSGETFDLRVDRQLRVLDRQEGLDALGVAAGAGVSVVAFESENTMTNTGDEPWTRRTGLLSIWILGMFKPSPETTVVIPFRDGPVEEFGPIVNDVYFGRVPADRLVIADGVLFFGGDGQYRSKIGLSPHRAKEVLGSYDATHGVLTVVQYNQPAEPVDYVNSVWELQEEPYGGDVVNSYNDGPPAPGAAPLGPFYELETSSPAAALAPGRSILHTHRTFHFTGSQSDLDRLAREVLGVSLAQIEAALP